MSEPTLLEKLHVRRAAAVEDWAKAVEKREGERAEFEQRRTDFDAKAEPTDEERTAHTSAVQAFNAAEESFRDDSGARKSEIEALDARIEDQQGIVTRRAEAAAAAERTSQVTVRSEPRTYFRPTAGDSRTRTPSYFADLAARHNRQAASQLNTNAAIERLERHAKEVEVDLPKREQRRRIAAEQRVDAAERSFTGNVAGMSRRGLSTNPFEFRTNPNRTDGQGGYFVPPVWLIDEYIPALRAGRVAAGLARNLPMPEGTDSINIPKLSTTTQVAAQTADNAGVASQDFTDTSVSAGVKTLAGQEDVGIQLLDQSPGHIVDQVVAEDLMADYNRLVDRQLVSGAGNSGQLTGIYPSSNWSGTNAITWTSATPLGPGFNMVLGAMASQVAYNRFDLTDFAFLLHPRRWFWFATALDGASGTSGRPVVSAESFGPLNASALEEQSVYEGLAGRVPFGPSAYIDANVPTNESSTRDVAIGALWSDVWLFEGEPRFRVLPEVLSGTLEVRFQVYNYVASLVRYGQALAIASGTGFAAPASALDSTVTF